MVKLLFKLFLYMILEYVYFLFCQAPIYDSILWADVLAFLTIALVPSLAWRGILVLFEKYRPGFKEKWDSIEKESKKKKLDFLRGIDIKLHKEALNDLEKQNDKQNSI